MDYPILCVILFVVHVKYAGACSISRDENIVSHPCILTCTDLINGDTLGISYEDYYNGYQNSNIRCKNSQNRLYISELRFKLITQNGLSIPTARGYQAANILNAISSLDISDNDFNQVPAITVMNNLELINLTRNNLDTAILSNLYELNMLTEIDYSYNIITDIRVNDYEKVYRKLKRINISHNKLVKVPEAIFDQFHDLQALDLSYNQIRTMSVATFEGVRKLMKLNLSNNRLTSINGSLFRFSALNVLDLSSNEIEDIKANDFQQLREIRTLDLNHNTLKVINADIFRTTTVLETLDLSNNLLETIETNAFSNLQALSDIDLSKNKLKSLTTDLFKNSNIFNFSITQNLLEGAIIKGMLEGINVKKLDFSYQLLTEVKDYAFHNMSELNVLLLNSNYITSLTNKCFMSLVNLEELNLSGNEITSIHFETKDLGNLKSLQIKHNRIANIEPEVLRSLTNLRFLDISGNLVSHLESYSFQSLKNLINLEIHSNPLAGTLETKTFDGLVSLPSLDISHSMIITIQNASFSNMRNLKEVKMTNCQITDLQYNAFMDTMNIEILDFSQNKLTEFYVNFTHFSKLSTLLLNNNLIKTILPSTLKNMPQLNNISLSHNFLEKVPKELLFGLIHLHDLDFSYNEKINFTVLMVKQCKTLNRLILSGIKTAINFDNISNYSKIFDLVISNASITNVSNLHLNQITTLASLDLSYNDIFKLQQEDFSALVKLKSLDLSNNKISFIQTGSFKDNDVLDTLNISHNYLSSVNYGVFRGLNSLKVLDLSYNKIKDLQSERFYEVKHLTELIVDFNQIDSIDAEDFDGTHLSKLSIGNNPISCQILVKLDRTAVSFKVTAIGLDYHSNENVNGVVCNKGHTNKEIFVPTNNSDYYSLFSGLRNFLEDFNNKNIERDANDNKYLEKISTSLEKLSEVLDINNNSNVMLNKIIKLLNQTTATPILTPSVTPVTAVIHAITEASIRNTNSTPKFDSIFYINHVKKELENTIAVEKQNVINLIENKLVTQEKHESLSTNIDYAKIISSNNVSTFLYTGTYIALTLSITLVVMLIGFVIFRMYKSRLRGEFSISNHVLTGALDNSTL